MKIIEGREDKLMLSQIIKVNIHTKSMSFGENRTVEDHGDSQTEFKEKCDHDHGEISGGLAGRDSSLMGAELK